MGIGSFFRKLKNKRRLEMEQAAYELSGKYSRTDEFGLVNLLLDFKLFKIGHSKKIRHIIEIKDEQKIIHIFDYQYTITAGNSSRTFRQTVYFFNSKQLGLTEFYLRPEYFIHRIKAWFGVEDIDFESHPEFSDNYYLTGENEDRIRHHFDENVLRFFTIEKDWSLEGINYFMIFYKSKKKLPTTEIVDYFKKAEIVYLNLKEDLNTTGL